MPISFELPADAQQLLQDLREWSLTEVRPLARIADTDETKYFEGSKAAIASCPLEISPLSVPELGLVDKRSGKRFRASDSHEDNHVLGVLAMEAMTYGDGWAWGALARNANLEKMLSVIGTPEQLEQWNSHDGDQISSFAFTEDHCGSDIGAIKTRAVRHGDEWVIDGTKRFSSQAGEASIMLVFVTIDPTQGMRGLRGVMIPAGLPGIEIIRETEERKLGMRFLRQGTVRFNGVRVPFQNMLGDPYDPNAFLEGLNVLNRTRPFCMAWSVGTMRGAADYVRKWAGAQITGFNPQRWRRVQEDLDEIDSAMDDLMRLLVRAAWCADRDLPHRTEAAMAKAHGPRIIERGYRRLLAIMGSEAASEEHLLEKWYRDAVLFDMVEGTSQILKLTVGRGLFAQAVAESGADAVEALKPVVPA
jgi:alkylation response protein AidB-like acyl-CoA dehydrogenase